MSPAKAAIVALALFAAAGSAQAGQPFLFGAYTGNNMKTAAFETMIGHTIAIVDHFQTFSEPLKSGMAEDIAEGRVPLVSWTSATPSGGSVAALDILAGKYDSQLISQADAYAALRGTVMIEWQPEMTDNPRNTLFMAGVSSDEWGATYVAVWQYMHDLFAARHVTNAQWVWSPGGTAYENHWPGIIPCQAYFPGAGYVDWMGLHSYNKSDTPAAYDANPEFLAFYAEAPAWAPGVPLIHSQTGATHTTKAQAEWITTAESALPSEFPLVRGFVWFNANSGDPQQGYSRQYTLKGAGLAAFSAMAADAYFQ